MNATSKTSFTLAEAASLYNKDRSTLYRDAKIGKISTSGSNKGKTVALVELIRVYGNPPTDEQQEESGTDKTSQEPIEVRLELVRLQESLKAEQQLRQQLEQQMQQQMQQSDKLLDTMEGERDRAIEQANQWRKQFEQQNLLLTDERSKLEKEKADKDKIVSELAEAKSQPKRKWWQMWRG